MSDYDSCFSVPQNFSEQFPLETPIHIATVERLQSATPSQSKSPKVLKPKKKPIKKREKSQNNSKKRGNHSSPSQSKKGKAKRMKDMEHEAANGRPTNQQAEKMHLKENRSYNDIIYHYSRFMILLKIMQGNERNFQALQLTNQQSKWMSYAKQVMSIDNFPSFEEDKPLFLLHPNSIHFVIQYRNTQERKQYYSSEEMKFILLALLKKKEMLTENIYNYVCQYWQDIVYLANNPSGQEMPNQHPLDLKDVSGEPEDMHSSNEDEEIVNNENINNNVGRKKRQSGPSQIDLMRKQLTNDQTCIAYEIACYLHACYEKFHIKIRD